MLKVSAIISELTCGITRKSNVEPVGGVKPECRWHLTDFMSFFYFFFHISKHTYQNMHYYHVPNLKKPCFCDFWPVRTYIRSQEAISEKCVFFVVFCFFRIVDLRQAGCGRAAFDIFVHIFLWVFEALGLCCLCWWPQALFSPRLLRFSFSEALTNALFAKDCFKYGPLGLSCSPWPQASKLST